MRRSLTKFPNPIIGNATKQALVCSSFPFSTSSGGGRGRGFGRAFDSPDSRLTPEPPSSLGRGHGRGFETPDSRLTPEPLSPLGGGLGRGTQQAPPIQKPSISFVAPSSATTSHGRGRGGGTISFTQADPIEAPDAGRGTQQAPPIQKPSISFVAPSSATPSHGRGTISVTQPDPIEAPYAEPIQTSLPDPTPPNQNVRPSILTISSDGGGGQGRGKPVQLATEKPTVENRHIRSRRYGESSKPIGEKETNTRGPKMNQQEAIDRARSVLSRGGEGSGSGIRGRGRGRGRRGRGRGGQRVPDPHEDDDDDEHDNVVSSEVEQANEEAFRDSLVMDLGEEKAGMVVDAFEEATQSALPSPLDDAYLDGMEINYMIECEPEYMVDFGNPDLDEKPPIPLRNALEKMKPFLMAYEHIKTDEEWEEVVKDAMGNVPLMKKIVDDYGGPDRVTAKRQQGELERVAKTLPGSTPNSVKRFTDRALLSLQSNPGWGFHSKCQFMDKLVAEVSKRYK